MPEFIPIRPFDEASVNVSLKSPSDQASGVSVYLYTVKHNAYMHSMREEVPSNDPNGNDGYNIQKFDMNLDLYYMITPQFKDNHPLELKVIERILQVINGVNVLGGGLLKPELAGTGNDQIRMEPISLTLDEINKIWSIFPNQSYHLSLYYQLTPVKIKSFAAPEFAFSTSKKEVGFRK